MWFPWKTLSAALGGARLVGDTWGTGGSPPSLGSPQCDTRLVTAWSPPSKASGLRTPGCRFSLVRIRGGHGWAGAARSSSAPHGLPRPTPHPPATVSGGTQWLRPRDRVWRVPPGKPRRRPEATRPASTNDRKPHVPLLQTPWWPDSGLRPGSQS